MSLSDSLLNDEVTTIYVVGFPDDMREREFRNLFTFAPGFQGCSLKFPNEWSVKGQILGFARFTTISLAHDAIQVLSGLSLDADSVLRAEMAKKNLHLAPNRCKSATAFSGQDDEDKVAKNNQPLGVRRNSFNNLHQAWTPPTRTQSFEYNEGVVNRSLNLFVPGNPLPISIDAPNVPAKDPNELKPALFKSLSTTKLKAADFISQTDTSSVPFPLLSTGDTTVSPCNTIYIGNLPLNVEEEEVEQLFFNQPGFKKFSFKRKMGAGPISFCEFVSVDAARAAIANLNGHLLSNSTKGGLRLQFSKNPLGVRTSNLTIPQPFELSSSTNTSKDNQNKFPSLGSTAFSDIFRPSKSIEDMFSTINSESQKIPQNISAPNKSSDK